MKKTKNSTPSSEFESKDRCPSCGSFCDINKDIDENDECNDCRSSRTAVEFILNLVVGEDEQGKDVRVKDILSKPEIDKAKEMEEEQREKTYTKAFDAGYNYATEYYKKTFKSE